MSRDRKRLDTIIGLAALGSSITGVVSLIAALFPFFNGEFDAVGLCLIAAALSFGLLANALIRG
jgi:hypothetical protein